jgi:UDP-N-acetyl-D-glucosamine dehydrogenase
MSLTKKNIKIYDCIVISTDHSLYDYNFIAKNSKLVVDTRDAMKAVCSTKTRNIVKA